MSSQTEWSCWEIMQCNPENAKQCPAYNSASPCWEVMRGIDPVSFSICRDCIVYVIKQKSAVLSQEEINNIMQRKGMEVKGCPRMTSSAQDGDGALKTA